MKSCGQGVSITIPSAIALGITEAVRVIVRTPRGVRLVDFGTPPPVQVDDDGMVTNANIDWIDNCLYFVPDSDSGINWGLGSTQLTPPLELPDWTFYLGSLRGVDVQLVTLTELEPSELIRFRSRDHTVNVTADNNGRVIVPVFLPVATQMPRASLVRMNQRSIAGHFTIDSMAFVRKFTLPAGVQQHLRSLGEGRGELTTTFHDRVEVHEIGMLGALRPVRREPLDRGEIGGRPLAARHFSESMPLSELKHEFQVEPGAAIQSTHQEATLNPQPLPPHSAAAVNPQPLPRAGVDRSARNPLFATRISFPGMLSLSTVPGFPEAPVAFAKMADGSTLVLNLGPNGLARVAGTYDGPVGDFEEAGDWAIARKADRISVYRSIRA